MSVHTTRGVAMANSERLRRASHRWSLSIIVAALAVAAALLLTQRGVAAPSTTTYGATMYALMTENFDTFPGGPLPQTSVEVVDAGTMTPVRTVPLGQRIVLSLAVSPDEQRLYVVDRSVGVAVLEASDGSSITTRSPPYPRGAGPC